MASADAKDGSEHVPSDDHPTEMEDKEDDDEEEEELFEINLEAAERIPPPRYLWPESHYSNVGSGGGGGRALLANCLLPIDDLSDAVPAVSRTFNVLSLEEIISFGIMNYHGMLLVAATK